MVNLKQKQKIDFLIMVNLKQKQKIDFFNNGESQTENVNQINKNGPFMIYEKGKPPKIIKFGDTNKIKDLTTRKITEPLKVYKLDYF